PSPSAWQRRSSRLRPITPTPSGLRRHRSGSARRCPASRSPISPRPTRSSRTAVPDLRIGVLAIQGGFEAHVGMLRGLGAEATGVPPPAELTGFDGLVIPGGESTTIVKGIRAAGLEGPIRAHHTEGRAVLGTCAGMIVCDDAHLGLIDATA